MRKAIELHLQCNVGRKRGPECLVYFYYAAVNFFSFCFTMLFLLFLFHRQQLDIFKLIATIVKRCKYDMVVHIWLYRLLAVYVLLYLCVYIFPMLNGMC